ncbi:MAG: FAD-dependent oxidoreductase, partial [Patescibacteria group bacterium]
MSGIQQSRVAVIGGGIFGTTCALVLGERFRVTLFERHSDILQEASYKNQYRHHGGYHYPRSPATIQEIRSATKDFEEFYHSAILTRFPSYYAVAKEGSKITAEEFLRVCDEFGLPYVREYPDPRVLNPAAVDVCIRTPEAIYDHGALKHFIRKKLSDAAIEMRLNCAIVGAEMDDAGAKILTSDDGQTRLREKFDYVINATYAHYNDFCGWLGFP